MTEYHKFLKSWTSSRGITSYLGSDKADFLQDWKGQKLGESMGREDINRAGAPFKKPIRRSAAEAVFTNPDLLKTIGAFTNPNYLEPPDLDDNIKKYNEILKRFEDDLQTYENPPKRRQTERAKKEREKEKNTLNYSRDRLRLSFDELIAEPLYRYLEKLWALKYGGQPGTIADKSNFSDRRMSEMLDNQLKALFKKYGVESPRNWTNFL